MRFENICIESLHILTNDEKSLHWRCFLHRQAKENNHKQNSIQFSLTVFSSSFKQYNGTVFFRKTQFECMQ